MRIDKEYMPLADIKVASYRNYLGDEKGWEIFDYLGSLFTDKAIYPENEKGNHHLQRGGALHLRARLLPE